MSSVWGGPLAGWINGGEVGSPIWTRIRVMGSGSVRNAMKVRGSWRVGQIRGKTSWIRARRAAHLEGNRPTLPEGGRGGEGSAAAEGG